MARRPSIYIGLGGTGIKAIAKTKKLYEEEYGVGNIPPEISFLAIDFDETEPQKIQITDLSGDYLALVSAVNPQEHYRVRNEQYNEFGWMFPGNSAYIDTRIANGAKQVRTTGRLYTEIVLQQIQTRIRACYTSIQNIANARGIRNVDIHLAMSMAGGTGAGSFLTLALLINQMYGGNVNLYGYGVLHGVFRTMDPSGAKTPRVITNAIASVVDLDYLQHASPTNPIYVELGPDSHKLEAPLFKEFYVIDNVTENEKIVKTCEQLCEVIGTCLYVSGSELGHNKDSLASNIGWTNGNFNVQTKRGWVYGLGACQVVYKGEELSETYAHKAARELIRKMIQRSADVEQSALDWTEAQNIREDGDQFNLLIDTILPPAKIAALRIPLLDVKNSDPANKGVVIKELETYSPDFPAEEALKTRIEDLCKTLQEKIAEYLTVENGVGDALVFLASLKSRCKGYKVEMDTEKAHFVKLAETEYEKYDASAWKTYESEKKGPLTIRRDEKNQELLDDIIGRPVLSIRKHKHEAKRREEAAKIFVSLIEEIEKLEDKVGAIKSKIESIDSTFAQKVESLQRDTTSSLVFEYDLSYSDRVKMRVNNEEIQVAEFIASLSSPLMDIDIANLDDLILNYSRNLANAIEYKEKRILDVIANLPDEDYEKLKAEMYEKSSLLLKVDGRGQAIERVPVRDRMVNCFMIASYDNNGQRTRFEDDQYFLPQVVDKEFTKLNSEVMKQKLICYRVSGAIIPYCIGAFDEYTMRKEYEEFIQKSLASGSQTYNAHFDAKLFGDMVKNNFKLKPEMKDEALFYWVCGHIFGWPIVETERIMKADGSAEEGTENVEHTKYVACIKQKYYYWDDEKPAGKLQKWQLLDDGGGTSKRNNAFNYFKTIVLPKMKESMHTLVVKNVHEKGIEYYNYKVDSIIGGGIEDYINKLVCANKNSSTYFARVDAEVELIQKEFDYICRSLKNALSNLK